MKFDAIWPRHMPKGLTLSREQIRTINRKARLARKREWNYRGAFWRNTSLYSMVALPALTLFFYFGLIAGYYFLAHVFIVPLPLYALYCRQRTLVPYVRRALCEAGHEVCMDCGYLLLGLPEETEHCPECGAKREYRSGVRADARAAAMDDYTPLPKYRWD
jgi:hypothetical protein